MYKTKTRSCIAAILLFVSNYAFAEEGVAYMGVGYHMGTYDESGFDEFNPTGLKLKAGKLPKNKVGTINKEISQITEYRILIKAIQNFWQSGSYLKGKFLNE